MHDVLAASANEGFESASDDITIEQAAQGDIAAFELIYQRYRKRVYWYVRTRTQSDEDAADLTQQVFVRALDALPRYSARKGSFASWLLRIAHNAAIDSHRRRHDTVAWDLVPEALYPRVEHDLAADVAWQESLARLRPLIAALPADKRELLALRFAGGLTIAEMGKVIGKSEEATRKALRRTLQLLEEQYGD